MLLAARQLAGQLVGLLLHAHQSHGGFHPTAQLGPGHATHAQAKADVVAHRHVRKQRIVLKDHAKTPVLGFQQVNALVVKPNGATGHGQQARNAIQCRRLATTRRPQKRNKFPPLDIERDPVERLEVAKGPRHALNMQRAKVLSGLQHHLARFAPTN